MEQEVKMDKVQGMENYLSMKYYDVAGRTVRQKSNGLYWIPRVNAKVFKDMETLGHVPIDGRHWWPKGSPEAEQLIADRAAKTVQPDTSSYTQPLSQRNLPERHEPSDSQYDAACTATEDQPSSTEQLPHETQPDRSDS